MKRLFWGLGLLFLPTLVHAELFVCGDATQLRQWFFRDPSAPHAGDCTQVAKNATQAQVDLIITVGRLDYVKVVSGLAVEKTAGEKATADAALAAADTTRQVLLDELTTSTTCNATDLATVNSRLATRKTTLDAQIEGIAAANLASLKAGLHGIVDDEYTILQAIARCLTALRKVINR